ncbi:DeoR/GlpR family DNA-binding transcription regulator [Aureimonas frigidaquae]|uniref:DeoR/GlpR family DNA-binding transcription regulator n=1 Tax=Aureimonas frigidaquae TaxID=424757 RepID=UPI0007821375|nr:DeoR/GlpR family DNA-binding transcription regulator [Aureimonas frigidaquae]
MTVDLPIARRELIAGRLEAGQAVSAPALAAEFSISEDAIRRDLRALAAQGRCRRVYGGALPVTPATAPLTERIHQDRGRKEVLASFAASTVRAGQLVFLDSGSTNLALVGHLPEDADVTVVTNSIPIAAEVIARQDLRLIMVGGEVNLPVGGCVDASATTQVERMTFDRCFLGACAISPINGLSVHDFDDGTFKRILLARSRQTLVLATTEKLGTSARHRVADVAEVGAIVVEPDAPDGEVQSLSDAGATMLRAIPAQVQPA